MRKVQRKVGRNDSKKWTETAPDPRDLRTMIAKVSKTRTKDEGNVARMSEMKQEREQKASKLEPK